MEIRSLLPIVILVSVATPAPPARAAKGLRIVAINLDEQRDKSDAFIEANPVPFRIAYDPFGRTAGAFHVKAMPTSFVVDRSGWNDKRLGHILDPRTGWPAKDAPRAITVLGPICLEAGTLSTLAYTEGPRAGTPEEAGRSLLDRLSGRRSGRGRIRGLGQARVSVGGYAPTGGSPITST